MNCICMTSVYLLDTNTIISVALTDGNNHLFMEPKLYTRTQRWTTTYYCDNLASEAIWSITLQRVLLYAHESICVYNLMYVLVSLERAFVCLGLYCLVVCSLSNTVDYFYYIRSCLTLISLVSTGQSFLGFTLFWRVQNLSNKHFSTW